MNGGGDCPRWRNWRNARGKSGDLPCDGYPLFCVCVCGPVTACVTDCERTAQRHGWSSGVCWAAPCRESRSRPCHPTRRWRGLPPMVGGWSGHSHPRWRTICRSQPRWRPICPSPPRWKPIFHSPPRQRGHLTPPHRCPSRSRGGNVPSAGQLVGPAFLW